MTLSRRALLLGLPVTAAAVAACSRAGRGPAVVNVREFGAVGDGVADDSDALTRAAAAIRTGDVLYVPGGRYRFARRHPPGEAAFALTGVSDVEVRFELDAEVVMDNVDPATQTGTSHGIAVYGPASNVSFRNVSIRWMSPTIRSFGDGIRVVGVPVDVGGLPAGWTGPSAPVRGVSLSNCAIEGSPQAGVVMNGVSDIDVSDLRVRESRGDGLHFNACRRGRVDGHSATRTGDDGLAFVTYFSDEFAFDPEAETFSFSELTSWSNTGFVVRNVSVQGGRANGVRIAGAEGVEINDLRVAGVGWGAGVIVDSAAAGADTGWNYTASRGIRLSAVTVEDCESGLHVLARPDPGSDDRFSRFDVHVTDAVLSGCSNWGVRLDSLTGRRLKGVRLDRLGINSGSTSGGHGGIGLQNSEGMQLGTVKFRHSEPVVVFDVHDSSDLQVDRLAVDISPSGQQPGDAPPCIDVHDSQGTFGEVEVSWPGAPASWRPVRVTSPGTGCGEEPPSVTFGTLVVEPASVSTSPTTC